MLLPLALCKPWQMRRHFSFHVIQDFLFTLETLLPFSFFTSLISHFVTQPQDQHVIQVHHQRQSWPPSQKRQQCLLRHRMVHQTPPISSSSASSFPTPAGPPPSTAHPTSPNPTNPKTFPVGYSRKMTVFTFGRIWLFNFGQIENLRP